MIKEHLEDIESDFAGTVIDIETIGDFNRQFNDSRRYMDIKQVIFGYINSKHLRIYCAEGEEGIEELQRKTPEILKNLERPYYAFNCEFESGVWFHHVGVKIDFDGELQAVRFESKKAAVKYLEIPNYDDPFFDIGFECIKAWNTERYNKAVAHNRACLLKERDILLKRGNCQPQVCKFVKC